jgi:hypothetical protein
MAKAGVLLTTDGLQPNSKGARVRISGGKFSVTDGPFTEAKELIAGYAIVRVKSKEEAIEQAKRFLTLMGEGIRRCSTGRPPVVSKMPDSGGQRPPSRARGLDASSVLRLGLHIFGVVVWAGIFLRDDRLRTLVPLRVWPARKGSVEVSISGAVVRRSSRGQVQTVEAV